MLSNIKLGIQARTVKKMNTDIPNGIFPSSSSSSVGSREAIGNSDFKDFELSSTLSVDSSLSAFFKPPWLYISENSIRFSFVSMVEPPPSCDAV